MVHFNTIIEKFGKKGEKTGWTYIKITEEKSQELNPNTRTSYRVKGTLDAIKINAVALIPMGDGNFILPLNLALRKKLKKKKGDTIQACLTKDSAALKTNENLLACLQDEPKALNYFNSLTASHQRYFSNWIDSAKTEPTQTKRLVIILKALSLKMDYGTMIRNSKDLVNHL
jgi:hypothetical protein